MSTTDTPPVTLDRITEAVEAVGLIPFMSSTGQVAAILPNRTVRIAAPEGRPAQGVADYPRFFDPAHADVIASAVRRLNASTYLPKVTSTTTDSGAIASSCSTPSTGLSARPTPRSGGGPPVHHGCHLHDEPDRHHVSRPVG